MKTIAIVFVVAAIVLTFVFLQGRQKKASEGQNFEGYVNENVQKPDITNNAAPAQVNMKF